MRTDATLLPRIGADTPEGFGEIVLALAYRVVERLYPQQIVEPRMNPDGTPCEMRQLQTFGRLQEHDMQLG